MVIANHKNLVGSETDYAEKNRRMRAAHSNQRQLPSEGSTGHNVSSGVSENVSIENRDKRVENRDKSLDQDFGLIVQKAAAHKTYQESYFNTKHIRPCTEIVLSMKFTRK